jgi:hypothetical protein
MPSTSKAQAGFAAMSRTAKGRAALKAHGKTPMPPDVAKDYMPQKGQKISSLPRYARRK